MGKKMNYYEDKLSKFFDVARGEQGITEELIYNNGGNLSVISATTEDFEIFGKIKRELFVAKILNDVVLVVRVGNAGKCQYVKDECISTENVLVLKVKEEYKKKISVKWFSIYINRILLNNAKGDPLGQRNISKEIIDRIPVKIPKDTKFQKNIVKKYEQLDEIQKYVLDVLANISELKNKIISE